MVTAKLQKWGNSQGLRLSKTVLEIAEFSVGDDVEIIVSKRQILVRKVVRPRFDLAELVSRIPKNYKPVEVDLGAAVGKEDW